MSRIGRQLACYSPNKTKQNINKNEYKGRQCAESLKWLIEIEIDKSVWALRLSYTYTYT